MAPLDDAAVNRTVADAPPGVEPGAEPAAPVPGPGELDDPGAASEATDDRAHLEAGEEPNAMMAPDDVGDATEVAEEPDGPGPGESAAAVGLEAPAESVAPSPDAGSDASDSLFGTEVTGERPAMPEPGGAADESPAVLAPTELEPPRTAPNEETTPDTPAPAEPEGEETPLSPSREPRTVAELVAAALRAAGVRIAFTVPGESFLTLLDALSAAGIRVVATRHEGAASFAAEAHGQLTGRPAACVGTRAVGAANLAIGIHTAFADSTPMFVIVGDVRRDVEDREAFQQVDLVASFGNLATWAGRLDDPAQVPEQLASAASAALGGRPGPALLAIPEDVLAAELPDGAAVPITRTHPDQPDPSDVQAVLHLLAGAKRPVILAGAGVLRARCSNDLVRLAELLHVPVIASWRRGDVISNDHSLYLGMAGFGSPATVRARLEAADALLVLGSRLGEVTSFGYAIPTAGQRWIHVDVDPLEVSLGGSPAPERAIRADARAFVRAALGRLQRAVLVAEPVSARDAHNVADRAAWEAASQVDAGPWTGPGVHPGRVIATLRRVLPDDAIVTTDAGNFAGWAARGFRFRRPGTFLGPTSGAMGYGLPAALAAALVHRERRVIALAGDGGLGMTIAELETAVREDAQLVAIVFDNQQYGMIRMYQDLGASAEHPGTDLGPVDFAAMARACGARGVRVETDAAFEPALRTALAASGPSLIQLTVDRRWVSVDRWPAVDAEGRPFD